MTLQAENIKYADLAGMFQARARPATFYNTRLKKRRQRVQTRGGKGGSPSGLLPRPDPSQIDLRCPSKLVPSMLSSFYRKHKTGFLGTQWNAFRMWAKSYYRSD